MGEPDERPGRERLDVALVRRGLSETRERARALIMAGEVRVDGRPARKAGEPVTDGMEISVREPLRYVSRGGLKLEAALDVLGVVPAGWSILDVGISTGGFTDCLLQRGAARVTGVDVGRGQLAWRLRTDPRVTLMEGVNFRSFDPGLLPAPVDLAVIDVSFISLSLILPTAFHCVAPGGLCMPMVKPQFEAGPGEVGKGGVVRDPEVRARAVSGVRELAVRIGFEALGEAPAGVPGPRGNQEFFLLLRRPPAGGEGRS
ncbi:MAG: TlyA family RNA methyltransferase [Deltaproteobacteria bacterium]|nr:TlyA family RNA methyltransferase [Deltaproteobacteria bacterium]